MACAGPRVKRGAALDGAVRRAILGAMRMTTLLLALALGLAGPAAAQVCAPVPDISAPADRLHSDLARAPGPGEASRLSDELWALWTQAPDEAAQSLLDGGMSAIRTGDLLGAEAALTRLVEYCPDYAEGWNQRAFARFLGGRHADALVDLDRARSLSPRHLGVLTGRGLTLIHLGRIEEGQDAIREALRLNPWLSERALLPEGERDAIEL